MNADIKEQALEALRLQHQHWLEQGGTKSVLKALETYKQQFIDLAQSQATTPSTSDQSIRWIVVSIKNTEAIIQLLTNTDLLITKLNKQ